MDATRLEIEQNTPNPFNPSTTIAYTITRAEKVVIGIYTAEGRLVREARRHLAEHRQAVLTFRAFAGCARRRDVYQHDESRRRRGLRRRTAGDVSRRHPQLLGLSTGV